MIGFLKNLFGSKDKPYVDKQGIYFYVQCDNCGTKVKLRADKQHDLNRDGDGYVWHKTIVDNRCFRPMPTVVHLDGRHQVTQAEIEGGRYLTEAEYLAEEKSD